MKSKLSEFITSHSENIVIVVQGLGFVGSVMSLVCANAIKGDYAVIGVDLPSKRGKKLINDLNNGIFPLVIEDPKIQQFYNRKRGNLLCFVIFFYTPFFRVFQAKKNH